MTEIVIAGMPAAGHVNPSLPLVGELVRRGVRVTYYTEEEFRDRIEAVGARFRAYPTGTIRARDIAEATQTGSSLAVVARVLTATDVLVPFLVEELRRERPAAVMYDSNAIWGRMAAVSVQLPLISFMTTLMVGSRELKALTIREWIHALRPTLPDIPAVLAARRRVVRHFGRSLYPPAPTLPMRGDLTIFPIPPELQPPNPLIDSRCRFVGPTIDPGTRDATLDAELATHLAADAPLVMVSLGTLHTGTETFFRACFDALADLPARVLLVVGPRIDPAQLGTPPPNTLVRAVVPQLRVLQHAAVFVTHGGMNSALEGLAYGVPLVVVPQQVEQLLIGQAIAERGAATVLRHHLSGRAVPTADLRAAVEHALTDPSTRTAAKGLAPTITDGGGASAAAHDIQLLLAATT